MNNQKPAIMMSSVAEFILAKCDPDIIKIAIAKTMNEIEGQTYEELTIKGPYTDNQNKSNRDERWYISRENSNNKTTAQLRYNKLEKTITGIIEINGIILNERVICIIDREIPSVILSQIERNEIPINQIISNLPLKDRNVLSIKKLDEIIEILMNVEGNKELPKKYWS